MRRSACRRGRHKEYSDRLHRARNNRGRSQAGRRSRHNRDCWPGTEASLGIDLGTGQMADNRLEQRTEIFAPLRQASLPRCQSSIGIEHSEIELIFCRFQIDEKVVHLVQNFFGTRVGAINLVDADNSRQPRFSAFLSTKRVCGSGPSQASTNSSTPSTIESVRSTSPPKSEWPGYRRY